MQCKECAAVRPLGGTSGVSQGLPPGEHPPGSHPLSGGPGAQESISHGAPGGAVPDASHSQVYSAPGGIGGVPGSVSTTAGYPPGHPEAHPPGALGSAAYPSGAAASPPVGYPPGHPEAHPPDAPGSVAYPTGAAAPPPSGYPPGHPEAHPPDAPGSVAYPPGAAAPPPSGYPPGHPEAHPPGAPGSVAYPPGAPDGGGAPSQIISSKSGTSANEGPAGGAIPPMLQPKAQYDTSAAANANEPVPAEIEDPMCRASTPIVVPFEEITKASFLIKSGVYMTPCVPSHLINTTGIDIYLKQDFLQYTGSFKERGARYTLLMLNDDQRARGVVSASAGNHAQALCYHGRLLGVPVTVVMPTISPLMKIQNCRAQKATVLVKGKNMTEAKLWAMNIAQQNGMVYINGYDHPHVLAGQGTCGLEIVEQVPDVDAVVLGVGGGGLIAGVSVAIKNLKPSVQVIGVESTQCMGFAKALEAGGPFDAPCGPTLADGLAVSKVGFNSFATAAPHVDKMVAVPEEFIAVAILRLVEMEKCVVEGAGATGLAAILSGQLEELRGKKVVLILSGGNIDTTVLRRVMVRGLAADGRLVKFAVPVVDRPGGLQELTGLLTEMGVSIKEMVFERAWIKEDVFKMKVKVVCETRDMDHSMEIRDALQSKFKQVIFGDTPFPRRASISSNQ